MSENNGKRPNRASHAQIIAIHRKLEETLDSFPSGGVRYKEGWNDEKVASETSTSFWTVSAMRREMFGEIVPEFDTTIEGRLKKLEDRLAAFEARFLPAPSKPAQPAPPLNPVHPTGKLL